ncbi:helix-turn-helix domain-containing protein [Desulfovibrio sulfodismutans]|uniref:Helix-turn-helix domain-containing protein n=1 Tax=Desulfolutivibrio sulfodismutans TaxID=63561 RepID=A0A7K3NRW8_9BACT|nr:helix-turn-helix domain-containing protein [Desulfolutivibrio sulfodismutans]NDY57949.1 helix-turn-helix domain-containing protein [Desulfolutivibrio sulfodismutans]QLA14619.1 hypothetical protein GD606_19930 [Desulfolutivibrio sulfodismutans DSM 3696]
MRRSALNEVIRMHFDAVSHRYTSGRLGCDEAADLLGVLLSTFYRMRKRFDPHGLDGLVDQRIGKLSARRAPVDETLRVISLLKVSISISPSSISTRNFLAMAEIAALPGQKIH